MGPPRRFPSADFSGQGKLLKSLLYKLSVFLYYRIVIVAPLRKKDSVVRLSKDLCLEFYVGKELEKNMNFQN